MPLAESDRDGRPCGFAFGVGCYYFYFVIAAHKGWYAWDVFSAGEDARACLLDVYFAA